MNQLFILKKVGDVKNFFKHTNILWQCTFDGYRFEQMVFKVGKPLSQKLHRSATTDTSMIYHGPFFLKIWTACAAFYFLGSRCRCYRPFTYGDCSENETLLLWPVDRRAVITWHEHVRHLLSWGNIYEETFRRVLDIFDFLLKTLWLMTFYLLIEICWKIQAFFQLLSIASRNGCRAGSNPLAVSLTPLLYSKLGSLINLVV